jgi:hypothetical protein
MEGRTIPTCGGGDLVIGSGPPIGGVIGGWLYSDADRGLGGRYGFLIEESHARELAAALRDRETREVKTFEGQVSVTHGEGLAFLWFYAWGATTPESACRLYDGAIERAAEAIVEALEPPPAPALAGEGFLSGAERERLGQSC